MRTEQQFNLNRKVKLVAVRKVLQSRCIFPAPINKMVFTSVVNFVRARGPDEIWRKRRIFKLAAHYIGRRRNCYSIAIRNVHRALVYATKSRKLKKEDMAKLWDQRVTAACDEHGITYSAFRESLHRDNVILNRKTLADLACWEPYTFKALTDAAKERAKMDGLNIAQDLSPPKGVFMKAMNK